MATEDAKPESTLITEQETAGEEVHSHASGLLQIDKFSREDKKHEESLPENSLVDDKEEHAKVSNAPAVTKIDPEILHTGVDVLDETKTKTTEFSEMVSIEGESMSPDHAVSKKHDDSEEGESGNSEEQSTVEPEENHTENLHQKPTDYASPEEESPSETHIQERGIIKHVEEDLNDAVSNAHDTTVDSTIIQEDNEAPKEEILEVQRTTDDQNNIPEKVEEDKPNQDLTSSINHGNAKESAEPASTEGNGSLREFQSDAQTNEAASEDAREVLEVSIPAASEESKEDLTYITNVVPQVSEENSCDEKVIEKENDTIDRDALLRKPGEEEASVDISPNEEPQKAIKSEDIDYEKSIPGLASNDQTTKQEQEDKESIIETAEKCETEAEIRLQDHGKDTDLVVQTVEQHNVDESPEESSKEVASLDPDSRSTEAVSQTNVAEDSSAEALVDFPEEMPSVKLSNQETTQTSSEGTDTGGNIVCEATDASFATSLKEELFQNEGYEPAELNIRDLPRKDISSKPESREYQADDPLEGKSEKIEESSIEKMKEDAEISGGEHLADEQNQPATEDQNCKSHEGIPTSQDLSEKSEIHITAQEGNQTEDAKDSSSDVPQLESSLESLKEEQKQEAAPNDDVLQNSNQPKEPETTEETKRLNKEVEIQDKDVIIEEAVKSSSVEEKYIPDDALVSHEDSELKVDDTSDEMDKVSQTTNLEDTEQVKPNQDLTSSTDETYTDSGMIDNQHSKEEFINQEAEKGNLPLEEVSRDISPSNLTFEEQYGNVEESAKLASTEGNGSLQEFQSDAQADEADEIPKSVVPETVKDDREILEVSIPTASEETKEDLADITNVNSLDQEVIEKENDIIDGDAILRRPGKEDISQHEEPQKVIESEDIDCEKSIPGLASNEQGDKDSIIETAEKCAAGETKSVSELELQDHGKDVLSDSAVQTVEHHNVDQPLDDPLEGKSEKIEESSIEKKTEDAEITGGEHLADEQNQQENEPLSIEEYLNCKLQEDIPTSQDIREDSEIHITAKENDKENDIEGKRSAEDSSSDFPEKELSLETYQKDEPEQEVGPNAEVLQTFNQSIEPETTEDTPRLNTEVEIQGKDVKIEEAVKSSSVELKVDDVSDVVDNVSQNNKLEDAEKTKDSIPAIEGKVDDHDKNSTKEDDLKSEEYPGAIQDEMPETINSESTIVQMTDSEENKFIITEEPHTGSTPEEKEIYAYQEKEEKNTNDLVAGDDLEVRENEKPELSPIDASQITKVVFEETVNYKAVSEISEAEIDSNEDPKPVETEMTVATQSLKNQLDEEPALTAEDTIVQSPAEEKDEEHVTNSTKDSGLNSQVSTGETNDEKFETINRESPGTELEETATQKCENQTLREDQIDEEPFQVVTAEKTINGSSAEVEVAGYASNSTKEDDLKSEAFTGETKEEPIQEPQQVLTSEEIEDHSPAKEDGLNISDTTVIDELNQKVSEPEIAYDTESFRREMQGGENVVEELPELPNKEEIVYQPVERKEERTVNDATILDDECHQESMANEISSADNNSTENIKLEEGTTTEAAYIQTSDKEYDQCAFKDAAKDELTIEENSNVHQINETAEISNMLEEHKLIDVTQSVGEKDLQAEDSILESPSKSPIVEEVIVHKEESIAKVDEMNSVSESKSEDTRSNVDEMSENIINTEENTKFDETEKTNTTQDLNEKCPGDDNVGEGEHPVSVVQEEEPVMLSSPTSQEDENGSITEIQNEEATFPEGESREVTNQVDSSSTNIEEKDDLAVLQDVAEVHTPFESSTPVSDVEKEEEMTIIHPKDGDESLQPEVEPEGEVTTKEASIIMQDSSSREYKVEENFQKQGNVSAQTRVTNINDEEKDRDQNECQPALTTEHDSAREAEAIEELTSVETIEEPRQVSTLEETGDYSPAKEEGININGLNQKVLEHETIDGTENSTRQMQGEENVVEELPQLSNTEEIVYNAVEGKEETILDNELQLEGMVNETSSANNKITENIKLEEGITTEIAHEERTVEVPSQDSSSNKISSHDLSDKEHSEGGLNDMAIDESKIEGNLDFHHINDTAEVPSMENEATKLEEHKLNDATQSVGEKDLPAEDSPIVDKVIIYNPEVEDKEESIARVNEINSESKSEETTIEVEREPTFITTEGLLPDSDDREATNNVCDSNMEIEEKGVPEPQTDAIISGDTQVPAESPVAEHEDASKAVSNTVNTISKECTLNDDDKDEKVEEPVEHSSLTSVRNLHEHENDSTTEATFPEGDSREVTNQIDISSTKIEEKDGLPVFQDLVAVNTPFESSTPVSDVDNMEKEGPKTGTDAKITSQEEELTIIPPKDGDESLQREVEKNEPEGEVVSKEASIIMQDSSSKEQEIEEKFQVIEHNNSPTDVAESEAVPLPFKISDADQDMETKAAEDPKTGIDTKIASEDKIMSILEKSQAGETLQTETEKLTPESTSNVVAQAVSSSTPEISFKDEEMGANAKEQVRSSDQESVLNEDKESSEVENEQSLNNRPTDEMLTKGKVPGMLPEIQHGEEAKESMTSLEDLLQTSRNGNIKAAENETTILGNDSKETDKPYSDEDTKGETASDSPVLVEASRDADVKVTPKKSNNILSGVGSKVKNSIAKVKKVITGKSSSPKPSSPT